MDSALFDFEEESPQHVQMSGRLHGTSTSRPSAVAGYSRAGKEGSSGMGDGHVSQAPATAGVLGSSPPFGPGGNVSPLQRFVKAKGKINSIYEEIQTYVNDVTRFLNNLANSETNTDALKNSLTPSVSNSSQVSSLAMGSDIGLNCGVVEPEFVARTESYVRQVDAIRQVLSRDHMKVVFFGRTSNGKSTMINALLGERILPTGIGHTTSCFLQVEGGDEQEAFLMTDEEESEVRTHN